MKKLFPLFTCYICLTSCSTFRETHYFKDTLEPIANYFKVDVRGYSRLSSSRYVSGYYDRLAIQEYFGEIGQPEKGRFVPVAGTNLDDTKKELVLLLSSNSDAIANGFSNLVKNKNTINSIALIANKQKIEHAAKVQAERSGLDNKIEIFKMRIEAELPSDLTGMTKKQITDRYTQVVKNELAILYPGVQTPDTLNELYKWLLLKRD